MNEQYGYGITHRDVAMAEFRGETESYGEEIVADISVEDDELDTMLRAFTISLLAVVGIVALCVVLVLS